VEYPLVATTMENKLLLDYISVASPNIVESGTPTHGLYMQIPSRYSLYAERSLWTGHNASLGQPHLLQMKVILQQPASHWKASGGCKGIIRNHQHFTYKLRPFYIILHNPMFVRGIIQHLGTDSGQEV
jgi:hypothetical protein